MIKKISAKAFYKKNEFFYIAYPENLTDKQLRVVIAHELGHLYLLAYKNMKTKDNTEPLSTILGILMILDENEFYSTIAKKGLLHKDFNNVIADFKLLNNRLEAKYSES